MFASVHAGVSPIAAPASILSHPGTVLIAAAVVVVAVRHWWKVRGARQRRRAAANWPIVTATIEVPAVIQNATAEAKDRLVVSLCYFYRNPELQMGEFKRSFPTKERAKQWAAQFKGRTVPVHVNPADPTDSVLLESDVAGSDFAIQVPLKVGAAELDKMPQVISPAVRMVCGLAELAGLAGMATSAVLLAVDIAMHGKLRPYGYFWTGGILLGVCLASSVVLQIYLMRTEEGRWLLHSYKRWCPGWMRLSLNLTGGSVAFKPLWEVLNFVHLISPHSANWTHSPWAQALAPYIPYAIGGWLFFILTAFHAALLRSQEELHISVVEA